MGHFHKIERKTSTIETNKSYTTRHLKKIRVTDFCFRDTERVVDSFHRRIAFKSGERKRLGQKEREGETAGKDGDGKAADAKNLGDNMTTHQWEDGVDVQYSQIV